MRRRGRVVSVMPAITHRGAGALVVQRSHARHVAASQLSAGETPALRFLRAVWTCRSVQGTAGRDVQERSRHGGPSQSRWGLGDLFAGGFGEACDVVLGEEAVEPAEPFLADHARSRREFVGRPSTPIALT